MEWGLLWYDSHPQRTLADKVQNAALRYKEKFGQKPNTCYVRGLAEPVQANGCTVIGDDVVLEHHLWIGKEET